METLLAVLFLALLDSINPSALVVTLTLLGRGARADAVFAYVSGIFAAYLTTGVLLVAGLATLFDALGGLLESRAAGFAGAAIGAAMVLYSWLAPDQREERDAESAVDRANGTAGLFLLGAAVTVLELPTAMPYLGATGLLAQSGLSPAGWFPVLLVYNVIFVLPPLVLAAAYRLFSERASEELVARLRRGARETALWVIGIAGFVLLLKSLTLAFPGLKG